MPAPTPPKRSACGRPDSRSSGRWRYRLGVDRAAVLDPVRPEADRRQCPGPAAPGTDAGVGAARPFGDGPQGRTAPTPPADDDRGGGGAARRSNPRTAVAGGPLDRRLDPRLAATLQAARLRRALERSSLGLPRGGRQRTVPTDPRTSADGASAWAGAGSSSRSWRTTPTSTRAMPASSTPDGT